MTKSKKGLLAIAVLLMPTGCQLQRMPGSLLPSLAAAREERAIVAHAAKSGFPSPSDVGIEGGEQADE